ncbi:Protein of unknown function [Cnuella takakiae]|uniref:DUF4197 domain-containing protein n=1 Tax=Cnuella takakiae TaxID=1302690 RepID=A0A1M5GWE8_9BACT|nr:DUF4197 domain-containing protein [Cnuella takakiae]OLY94609.1 hypothetical protein BUE76_02350 [Cnuella takakiae]SHG08049.1 Protein of unknown function [Cnuella takakiae]
MIRSFSFLLLLLCALSSCGLLQQSQVKIPLTETEAAQGIREALDQGVGRGIAQLHREDGFFRNNTYKILLPAEAQKVEAVLRQMGMDALVDRTILQINRAAEDAVGAARPIFAEAISGMTLTDALTIVQGQQDAATQYFRQKTTNQLKAAFTPIIRLSLDKFSATKYYEDLINTYNNFPTTLQKVNPDLAGHVADKAVVALFDQIATEEARIRSSGAARATPILKRVFGR